MSEKKNTLNSGGGFAKLGNQVRLILRLLGDNRVNPLVKILPIGAAIYALSLDPIPGPIDDTILLYVGGTIFVEFCPPDVVQEHRDEIANIISSEARDTEEEDIIDADARDIG